MRRYTHLFNVTLGHIAIYSFYFLIVATIVGADVVLQLSPTSLTPQGAWQAADGVYSTQDPTGTATFRVNNGGLAGWRTLVIQGSGSDPGPNNIWTATIDGQTYTHLGAGVISVPIDSDHVYTIEITGFNRNQGVTVTEVSVWKPGTAVDSGTSSPVDPPPSQTTTSQTPQSTSSEQPSTTATFTTSQNTTTDTNTTKDPDPETNVAHSSSIYILHSTASDTQLPPGLTISGTESASSQSQTGASVGSANQGGRTRSEKRTSIIVGAVLGSIAAVFLYTFILWYYWWRKRKGAYNISQIAPIALLSVSNLDVNKDTSNQMRNTEDREAHLLSRSRNGRSFEYGSEIHPPYPPPSFPHSSPPPFLRRYSLHTSHPPSPPPPFDYVMANPITGDIHGGINTSENAPSQEAILTRPNEHERQRRDEQGHEQHQRQPYELSREKF